MNRRLLFTIANVVFCVVTAIATVLRPEAGVHPLYVVMLFALCSGPILKSEQPNDRYALLVVFFATYFVMFGITDFSHIVLGNSQLTNLVDGSGNEPLSKPELVILVGGALLLFGYLVTCRPSDVAKDSPKDWPEKTLVIAGCLLWTVCTWLVWDLRVHFIVDTTVENIARGYASLGSVRTIVYTLATYLQPLGIVILAYAQCRYHRRYLLPLIAMAIAAEMVLGFVSDIKGQVVVGLVLIAITKLLVDGSIPKTRLLMILFAATLIFPILQANRLLHMQGIVNNARAAADITTIFKRAFSVSKEAFSSAERPDTFFERLSLKSSVNMIVTHAGTDVPYQDGYTLQPIVTSFIPRIIWPTKPAIETGRLVNRAFNVTESNDIYISPSYLGELYWNFGWLGVLLGMSLMGAILGYVGARCDPSRSTTLTRILVLLATCKLLILGFEGTIAAQYSQWLRTLVAIGISHVLLSRNRAVIRQGDAQSEPVPPEILTAHFDNLMP